MIRSPRFDLLHHWELQPRPLVVAVLEFSTSEASAAPRFAVLLPARP